MCRRNRKVSIMKLTDTQLIILADAAKRDDGAVVIPERLKGGAAKKVVEKLLTAGLIEEVQTKGNIPPWRQDEELGAVGLRITQTGLAAIGAEEPAQTEQAATDDAPANKLKSRRARGASGNDKKRRSDPKEAPRGGGPRTGTKRTIVIDMLQRPRGASLDELVDATGWLPHTTRAALTGLRKAGLGVERSREKRGKSEVSIYRIAGEPVAPASKKSARPARGFS
jgi:hypothetical protein